MFEPKNMHATCVEIDGAGVLLMGKSGSGKSDLALRLIENKNAVLISDDQTILAADGEKIWARAAENIEGKLEVRGVGICRFDYKPETTLKLAVNLDAENYERMPEVSFFTLDGVKIEQINISAFEVSAVDKIVVKLKGRLVKDI